MTIAETRLIAIRAGITEPANAKSRKVAGTFRLSECRSARMLDRDYLSITNSALLFLAQACSSLP
jgi:hypothetical protein